MNQIQLLKLIKLNKTSGRAIINPKANNLLWLSSFQTCAINSPAKTIAKVNIHTPGVKNQNPIWRGLAVFVIPSIIKFPASIWCISTLRDTPIKM